MFLRLVLGLGLGFGLFYYLAILEEIKHKNMSVWWLETSIDRLKSVRASSPCQSLHLWKTSIDRKFISRSYQVYTEEGKNCRMILAWKVYRLSTPPSHSLEHSWCLHLLQNGDPMRITNIETKIGTMWTAIKHFL